MGKLIVIEGLDGSGKSTQTENVLNFIKSKGVEVRQIKLPDYESESSALVRMYLGGEFGTHPKDVNAYAASSFYAVDRYANYNTKWKDDYLSGKVILADRYATSNAAHQMTKLDKSEWDEYLAWLEDFEYVKIGIPKPSLVVFLDMPVEISQKLMTSRYKGDEGKKDVHEADVAYLLACREAGMYAAKKLGWNIVKCYEGDEPRSIEDIARDIEALVASII
ncbi:MAG: deoxynucleoside kinase [Oscillospiraceae bacterium]|nr:deoxynucleoside kinase [Candidatus Limimonas coprohippi]